MALFKSTPKCSGVGSKVAVSDKFIYSAKDLVNKDGVLPIAVDVGRSAVKVCFGVNPSSDLEKFSFKFSSEYSLGFDSSSATASSLVNVSLDSHVLAMHFNPKELSRSGYQSLPDNGLDLLFGYTAEKEGCSHLFEFKEGSLFHEIASLAVLYSAARVVRLLGWDGPVALAINLTYLNQTWSSFYSKTLNGAHTVNLFSNDASRSLCPVKFKVAQVILLQQGYGSLFSFLSSGANTRKLVTEGTGLVIDIGRYTVDLSQVKQLTLSRGESFNTGVQFMLDRVSSAAAAQGFDLTDHEIEEAVLSHKSVKDLHGNSLDVVKLVKEATEDFYVLVKQAVETFILRSRFDYFVLVGGGCFYLEPLLLKDYKLTVLKHDYVFGNCLGMSALLNS